ncbi:MAG: hypothetical protein R8G66_11205 [Cytophagales bacterium]|nr:hypothetical protein [Cytophagales bacterium]
MKHFILVAVILVYGCGNTNQTDHRWIRAYSDKTIESATILVEEKGQMSEDMRVLAKMKDLNLQMSNLFDSIHVLPKEEILKRTSVFIEEMEVQSSLLNKFFNLTATSSDEDFQLQLSLLEIELLNYYQSRIEIMEVAFDRLELIFIPTEFSSKRIKGEVVFVAISDNVEKFSKIYINGKEIKVKKGRGLVDMPVSELKDGNVNAKIVMENSQYQVEQELKLLREF